MMLQGKKIVIGITGSIAAFKIPALVRLLVKEGAAVRVVMTPAAHDFVTPLTLSTLSGHPVLTASFNTADGTWNSHVEIGQWADAFVLAPVTANTLAKMSAGLADNLLMAVYLAAKCPVFFAPAMDVDMYRHPTTQENIKRLVSRGDTLIEPAFGELASGLVGEGRMEEPDNIIETLREFFAARKGKLTGKTVLVTAGPTFEAIDPVRYIGNHSSGLMGFSIAEEFASRGARVTLITGPTELNVYSPVIHRIDIVSAGEMHEAVAEHAAKAGIVVMSAAVSDFRPAKKSSSKIKKSSDTLTLQLEPTPDILGELGRKKKDGQLLIGFALETSNEMEHAREKLHKKNLDLIVMNSLKDKGAGFRTSTNKVTLIYRNGREEKLPLKHKRELARDLVDRIQQML
jgi:phosphopantothenoylcysteine decarboxylase/phosphopantothenate--cysteine ligase